QSHRAGERDRNASPAESRRANAAVAWRRSSRRARHGKRAALLRSSERTDGSPGRTETLRCPCCAMRASRQARPTDVPTPAARHERPAPLRTATAMRARRCRSRRGTGRGAPRCATHRRRSMRAAIRRRESSAGGRRNCARDRSACRRSRVARCECGSNTAPAGSTPRRERRARRVPTAASAAASPFRRRRTTRSSRRFPARSRPSHRSSRVQGGASFVGQAMFGLRTLYELREYAAAPAGSGRRLSRRRSSMNHALRNAAIATAVAVGLGVAATPTVAADRKAAGSSHDRGRYLVTIGGCNDCHTPGYAMSGGKVDEKQWLTGDSLGWHGPWGTTYPVNLLLYVQKPTEKEWIDKARHLTARPPMPFWALNA